MLSDAAQRGEISLLVGGMPAGRDRDLPQLLADTLDQSLALFARSGLLVG